MGNAYLNTQKLSALPADYNAAQIKSAQVKGASTQEYTFAAGAKATGDFAQAVYQDSPYSLEHPNNKTEIVAQNCDYLA